jgi:hypothetical protein
MLRLLIASLVWTAQTDGAARKQQQMEKLVAAGLDIDTQQRGLRDLMAETDGEATAQTAK